MNDTTGLLRKIHPYTIKPSGLGTALSICRSIIDVKWAPEQHSLWQRRALRFHGKFGRDDCFVGDGLARIKDTADDHDLLQLGQASPADLRRLGEDRSASPPIAFYYIDSDIGRETWKMRRQSSRDLRVRSRLHPCLGARDCIGELLRNVAVLFDPTFLGEKVGVLRCSKLLADRRQNMDAAGAR